MRDEGGLYLASISWRDDLFGMWLFIASTPLGTHPPRPEEPLRSTVGLGSHSARFTTSSQQTPAQLSQNRHTDRRHLSADDCCTFKIQWLVEGGRPSNPVDNNHLRMGRAVVSHKYLEMMSALILYVLSPSSSCFCPSRSKHHRLKSAGAALILLGACELSVSFSLDSLKGSLSFPLGFHCLLAASSAGQITACYLHFECIWEGFTVSCTVLDPSAEKREVLSAPERWQKSDRRAAGALNVCQCISPPMGFVSWIPVL